MFFKNNGKIIQYVSIGINTNKILTKIDLTIPEVDFTLFRFLNELD